MTLSASSRLDGAMPSGPVDGAYAAGGAAPQGAHRIAGLVALVLVALHALSVAPLPVEAGDVRTVNPETVTSDQNPSVAEAADGSVWVAWQSYDNGREAIRARRLGADGTSEDIETVSSEGDVHGHPSLAIDTSGRLWCLWTAWHQQTWRILTRSRDDTGWGAIRVLSETDFDAVSVAVTTSPEGGVLAAWSVCRNGQFRVRAVHLGGDEQAEAFDVSAPAVNGYRPVPVASSGSVWIVWDQYEQRRYRVMARRVSPSLSAIESVSPVADDCLTPAACFHGERFCVAWLRKQDVIGGPGVISQRHELQVAVRRDDGWVLLQDRNGSTVAAELTQGVMARLEPRVVPTGGYLGNRLRPELIVCQDRLWLLWERKSDHRGSTPSVAGDLCGRVVDGDSLAEAVQLHHGRVDYHPLGSRSGRFRAVASRLPQRGRRTYELFSIPDESVPFEQDHWTGWRPVSLPMSATLAERRWLRADGRTYRVYWGDLHCHNGLTADAEGEPDELQHYARDRAALDVVAFTNNDFYNVPLTSTDYHLGNMYARVHTRAGEFVSLPGFEWTSRVPGVPGAELADPGNWLPPYRNRSFPNHRSVLYPPSGGPLVHFTEVGNDIQRLNDAVQRAGGLTLSQHNAFRLSGHPVEVGLELTSGWGNYIRQRPELFHQALSSGARLGFVACGDTHRRAPGLSGALTALLAEDLTPESILDALRHRRCYATSGSRIFLDARANGGLMGEELTAADGRVQLTLRAVGTRPVSRATLVRDGRDVFVREGSGTREFAAEYTDEGLTPGRHWYYWRVVQEGSSPQMPGNLMVAHGPHAWSSPHWVEVPGEE